MPILGPQVLLPGFPTQVGWVGQHFLRCGPGNTPPPLPAFVAGSPAQPGGGGAQQGGGGGDAGGAGQQAGGGGGA